MLRFGGALVERKAAVVVCLSFCSRTNLGSFLYPELAWMRSL